MKELKERNKLIRRWCKKGLSYRQVGEMFGITRQRAHQIDHKKRVGFWARLLDHILWLFGEDY